MRLAIVVIAASLVAACAATRVPPGPAAAPKRPWVVYPDAEVKEWKNAHDYKGAPLCQRCHVSGQERLSADPIEFCSQCHDPKRMKHPYRVAQPTGAEGLPLMAGRLIACHTCHDPHDVKKFRGGLRAEYVSVCTRCHTAHLRKTGEAGAKDGW